MERHVVVGVFVSKIKALPVGGGPSVGREIQSQSFERPASPTERLFAVAIVPLIPFCEIRLDFFRFDRTEWFKVVQQNAADTRPAICGQNTYFALGSFVHPLPAICL